VAKLRGELRNERNAIAALRAEWAKLDAPSRIQGLADRHLTLRRVESTQFDSLDRVPARPAPSGPNADPIGAMIVPAAPEMTGSVPPPARARGVNVRKGKNSRKRMAARAAFDALRA